LAQPAEVLPPAENPIPALLKAAVTVGVLLGLGYALRHQGTALLASVPADAAGAAVFVVVGAVMTALGLPRAVQAFAAGTVFGIGGGFAWAMLGQLIGCAVDFFAARGVAGDWARRRLQGRLRRLDDAIVAQPFTAVLTLRLLPVGNNTALNLLAGVAGVAAGPFLAASAIGYVPQTLIFVLLGSGMQVGRGVQLGLGLGLFVLSAGLGVLMWRRGRRAV
jgi:uncharacterized membrane protein YdjX (TVP38/TMEM64 family)